MTENENDPVLKRLSKAAGNPRGPKLDDNLLLSVSAQEAGKSKPSFAERVRFASRRWQLSSLAAAGAVGALALVLTVPQQTSFRLSLGGSASNVSGAPESANKMAGGLASDSMMIAQPLVDFVAGEGLENTTGSADVFQVVSSLSGEDLTLKAVRFFGLSGTPKKETFPTLDGPVSTSSSNWMLEDGAKSIYGYEYGIATVSYYNADAYQTGECLKTQEVGSYPEVIEKDSTQSSRGDTGSDGSSPAVDPSAPTEYCLEYAPVESNLPTVPQAMKEALRIFNHFGYGVSESDLQVQPQTDYLSISAFPKVDGISIPLWSSVAWGNTGKLQSVNISSVDLRIVGSVETLGARDSVERANSWIYRVTPAEALDESAFYGLGLPYFDAAAPGEEPKLVEINSAEAVLGLLYDTKGGLWLVPSYKLYSNDGLAATVISVVDGVLDLPKENELVVPMTK